MEKTTIRYTVGLDGIPLYFGFASYVDNTQVNAGTRLRLGKHSFRLEHEKAEPFSTNFSTWYEGTDLGHINLQRSTGRINLKVSPTAATVALENPEKSVHLTNSSGWEGTLPTGIYNLTVHWKNAEHKEAVKITRQSLIPVNAVFALADLDITSEPEGARVTTERGELLGTTPLRLDELRPGRFKAHIVKSDFIPVVVDLDLREGSTNSWKTTLVNSRYAEAIDAARAFAKVNDYDRAITQAKAVLAMKPEDTEAAEILKKMRVGLHVSRALDYERRKAFTEAREEAAVALRTEPNEPTALEIVARIDELEKQARLRREAREAQELAEKQWTERLVALEHGMKVMCDRNVDSSLFDTHQLIVTNTVKDFAEGFNARLSATTPKIETINFEWPAPSLVTIEAKQPWFGALRKVLVAATETPTNTCLVAFRVLEYETHLNVNVGNFIKLTDGQAPLIALPNQKERVTDGIRLMKQLIGATDSF